jgi:parallel beta-helix repeat protein
MSENPVGIRSFGTSAGTLEKNVCEGGKYGIVVSAKASPAVRGNECLRNSDIALAILEHASPVVEGNTLAESPKGIVRHSTARATVGTNDIRCGQAQSEVRPR